MQTIKDFITNIETYGNCEFFVRDYSYNNTASKYVLKLNKDNLIEIKKYYYVYKEDFKEDFLCEHLVFEKYLGNNFSYNLTEVILGAALGCSFCTHNLALDNEKDGVIVNAIIPIIERLLQDQNLFSCYFLEDINETYKYIKHRIDNIINSREPINYESPLSLNEIIDNFENYLSLNKNDYKKLIKAKTADEYEMAIKSLK